MLMPLRFGFEGRFVNVGASHPCVAAARDFLAAKIERAAQSPGEHERGGEGEAALHTLQGAGWPLAGQTVELGLRKREKWQRAKAEGGGEFCTACGATVGHREAEHHVKRSTRQQRRGEAEERGA